MEDKIYRKQTAEKHSLNTLRWLGVMIHKFTDVLTDVAQNNIDHRMEELIDYYELMELYNKLQDQKEE
jgi:hypothetical protein